MFLIYQCVIYHFYSSKLQIYPWWLCMQCGTFFSCQLQRMVNISKEPWRILEEVKLLVSVHPLSQQPCSACGQGIWYLCMVPLHILKGDSPVSQCSPSMNFSAIWGPSSSALSGEVWIPALQEQGPFLYLMVCGESLTPLEVVVAFYIFYFCIPQNFLYSFPYHSLFALSHCYS